MKIKLLSLLAFFIILFSSILFAQTNNKQITEKSIQAIKLKGYPVSPFKDTLFYVYNNVGSFSASERANYISSKIKRLYEKELGFARSLFAASSCK